MDHIGAGLAALGVIGPGIGIGILAGLAAAAIGRNPDAAGQIRGIAIILAAFAEGLGVLAIVVGLLAIFIQPAWSPTVDILAVAADGGPPGRRRLAAEEGASRAVPDQPVLGHRQRAQLHPVLRDHLDVRVQAGLGDARRPQGADRAGPQGRRAGAPRPGERRDRSASPRSPRPAARRTRSWPAPRRSPRRRATRTSPRPARSSSACASARPPRSRPRSSARSPTSAPRSPTSPSRAAEQGRRRDDDRRAPAPPRRGVPRPTAGRRRMRRTDGPTRHGRAPLRRGRLRGRPARRHASRRGGASSTRPRRSSPTSDVGRMLANPAVAARAADRDGRVDLRHGRQPARPQPHRAAAPARPDRAAAARRRRVPAARRRPPGHHPRHRHQRRAARPRTRSGP